MDNLTNANRNWEIAARVLIRCFIMGVIVLLLWWGALALLGDLAYRIHTAFVPITRAQFNLIRYTGMLITKAAVSLFFFFPYIAIRLVVKH